MATLADIGEWFDNVWKKLVPAAGNLVSNLSQAGSQLLTNIGLTPPNPSVPTTAPGSGGNGGTSTGSPSGGGSSSAFFTEPVKFLGNLTKENTWMRVGLVILGLLLIFAATMIFMKQESPIAQTMRDIGER